MANGLIVEKGDTLANVLRRRIADKILENDYEPGCRLDEKSLAEEYGVSRTPVREALKQLNSAGLVTSRPHSGSVVMSIDQDQVAQLCEAVIELEALCIRLAARKMSAVEVGRIKEIIAASAAAKKNPDAFAAENRKFHSAIIAGTQNPHLADVVEMCRLRLAPYQRVQFIAAARRSAAQAEYGAIYDALVKRDEVAAAKAMTEHLAAAAVAIDEQLRRAGRI